MAQLIRTVENLAHLTALISWLSQNGATALQRGAFEVVFRRPKRTLPQNSKMWAMLGDVSKQRQLCVNGVMVWADADDWKQVFTGALTQENRIASGINGGLVFLGQRTSKMDKKAMADLITLMQAYGDENNLEWSVDVLPALKDGDSHYWRSTSRAENV